MNKNLYLISIIAAIFLPLGFLTGLLGINVGGIPGTDVTWAFWAVCALLAALGALGWWLLGLALLARAAWRSRLRR